MGEDNAEEEKKKYEEIKRNKIAEVISTIKLLKRIGNLFGIFRFSLVDGELHLPNRKMKYCALLIPAAIISAFVLVQKREPKGTLITTMDVIPSNVVLVQYAITAIIISRLWSQTFIQIFENFADLDGRLSIQTTGEFYYQSRCKTKKYFVLLLVYHIFSFTLDFFTDEEPVLAKLIIALLYFLENVDILNFCKLIAMLKRRLQIINSFLTAFIQSNHGTSASNTIIFTLCNARVTPEETFNWIGRASENNMKIRDLAIMYDKIGNICSLINDVSNFQIFMTLVSTFSYILIAIWSTVYYFRTPEYTYQWLMTTIIWCVSSIATVVVMSITCEKLLSVRNYTKTMVNQIIMDYDLPKTMRVQAKAFMQLIEAWSLRILIFDMFSVDITLILKFISVATTYLIVIIQISHFV